MSPRIYRNRGAPWLRADGTRVQRGDEFVPTEEELLRRSYKLEYVGPAPEDPEPAGPADDPDEAYPRDVGGGWFELPDGRKVQGLGAAREAMAETD